MKINYKIIILLILTILLFSTLFIFNIIKDKYEENTPIKDKIELEFLSSEYPKEYLMDALKYYNVQHPEIVYAQAILETGHFESKICKEYNNLFGLYDSTKGDYFKFSHWSKSVEAYISTIQYRYNVDESYYKFLTKIGYAEDPNYIEKVKEIVKIRKDGLKQND